MVARLLKRLAGRPASTSVHDGNLDGHNPSVERWDRSGPERYPLPSAWVKMHVWRRDHGRCVLCGVQESVWFNYVVPPWKGGSVAEDNLRLMCVHCSRPNKGAQISS